MKFTFTEEFAPDMTNHMFRESFICYTAAKEYISDEGAWDELAREFAAIDRLGE